MNANVFRFSVIPAVIALLASVSVALAAPVESVQSDRASAAIQKIDVLMSEQVVVQQMTALGITREQVDARLAQLSDAQLEQLAAQVDLLQAGGTIQGGNPRPYGPLCMFRTLGQFFRDLWRTLFCWGPLSTG